MQTASKSWKASAHFLYEMGILAKTPRSAFPFLGSGAQNVAEHMHRTAYVGLVLAQAEKNVDLAHVILLCLFHDIAESRSGDLNYVHQQYVQVDEEKIIHEMTQNLPCGEFIRDLLKEYQLRTSKAAIVAKDADNLEWIITLKEQYDLGNRRALVMIKNAAQRLKTQSAQQLFQALMQIPADAWYATSKQDKWWISREVS